jgi:hypothetical protein
VKRSAAVLTALLAIAAAAWAESVSVFQTRPADPRAVYVGDGDLFIPEGGDAGPVLQAAIDRAARTGGDFGGIVFLPEGSYLVRQPISIWGGVRLIGFGQSRPRIILPEKTRGYSSAAYLLHFKDGVPGEGAADAGNTTFFSALINVDIEIKGGNPGATAVRSNFAQLSMIQHVSIDVGDGATGIRQAGHLIEDVNIRGGRFGIDTERTSAGWQVLLMNCRLEGQREAAIRTREAGLTLIGTEIVDTRVGILVPPGQYDQLYLEGCRFSGVRDAAVVMTDSSQLSPLPGGENRSADRAGERPVTPGHLEGANALNVRDTRVEDAPTFLRFHPRRILLRQDRDLYHVEDLAYGLLIDRRGRHIGLDYRLGKVHRRWRLRDDVPELPPVSEWVSIMDVAGDMGREIGSGQDATAVLKEAVKKNRTVYLPIGRYRLTETLQLEKKTRLVALHPARTQLYISGGLKGYDRAGRPRPVLLAPRKGATVVTGLGIDAGSRNPGAVALQWEAGEDSFAGDLWFGFGGPPGAAGRGEGQLRSIWIRGGRGTLRSVWVSNILAGEGIRVTKPGKGGRFYLVSVEHHKRNEVVLDGVEDWTFAALQTEEQSSDGQTTAIKIRKGRNLRFANLFLYRVDALRTPHPQAIIMENTNSTIFQGLHNFSWGPYPFDAVVASPNGTVLVSEHEAARVELR